MSNCYCTFVDNQLYLKETYAMLVSFLKTKSALPFYIIIPSDTIEINVLNDFQEKIKTIDINNQIFIIFDTDYLQFNGEAPFEGFDYVFSTTHNKFLSISLLNTYEKVLFVDSDIVLFKNMDSVFESEIKHFRTLGGVEWLNPSLVLFSRYDIWMLDYAKKHHKSYITDEVLFNDIYQDLIKNKAYSSQDFILPYEDCIFHDMELPKYFFLMSYEEIDAFFLQDELIIFETLVKYFQTKQNNPKAVRQQCVDLILSKRLK